MSLKTNLGTVSTPRTTSVESSSGFLDCMGLAYHDGRERHRKCSCRGAVSSATPLAPASWAGHGQNRVPAAPPRRRASRVSPRSAHSVLCAATSQPLGARGCSSILFSSWLRAPCRFREWKPVFSSAPKAVSSGLILRPCLQMLVCPGHTAVMSTGSSQSPALRVAHSALRTQVPTRTSQAEGARARGELWEQRRTTAPCAPHPALKGELGGRPCAPVLPGHLLTPRSP